MFQFLPCPCTAVGMAAAGMLFPLKRNSAEDKVFSAPGMRLSPRRDSADDIVYSAPGMLVSFERDSALGAFVVAGGDALFFGKKERKKEGKKHRTMHDASAMQSRLVAPGMPSLGERASEKDKVLSAPGMLPRSRR